ncbi:Scr1 family TA system antitoxin-like transcriptional regulator [Streptomyces lasalocidi]
MRRQEALYDPEKTVRFILCEAALYHRPCPVDLMAQQLDRLYNLVVRNASNWGSSRSVRSCVVQLRTLSGSTTAGWS